MRTEIFIEKLTNYKIIIEFNAQMIFFDGRKIIKLFL